MINLSVKTNIPKLLNELNRFSGAIDDANYSTIKKVTASAKTQASKDIRAEYNIKKKDLDKQITTSRPIKYAGNYRTIITAIKDLALAKFGTPRQKKEGVEVSIKKGSKKIIRGGFISVMKSGHKGIYTRVTPGKRWSKGRPQTSSPNLPIDEKFSRGAGHIVTKKIFNSLKNFVENKYAEVFKRELKYRYDKLTR